MKNKEESYDMHDFSMYTSTSGSCWRRSV